MLCILLQLQLPLKKQFVSFCLLIGTVNIVNIFLLQRYLFLLFHSVTSIYQQFVFTLFLSCFMAVGWKIFSVFSVLHNLCDLVLNYISTILIVFFTLVSAFLEVIGAKESYVNNSLTLVHRCEIQSWETLQSISKSRACKYQAEDIPPHHNPSQSWKVTLISCKETEMRGGGKKSSGFMWLLSQAITHPAKKLLDMQTTGRTQREIMQPLSAMILEDSIWVKDDYFLQEHRAPKIELPNFRENHTKSKCNTRYHLHDQQEISSLDFLPSLPKPGDGAVGGQEKKTA